MAWERLERAQTPPASKTNAETSSLAHIRTVSHIPLCDWFLLGAPNSNTKGSLRPLPRNIARKTGVYIIGVQMDDTIVPFYVGETSAVKTGFKHRIGCHFWHSQNKDTVGGPYQFNKEFTENGIIPNYFVSVCVLHGPKKIRDTEKHLLKCFDFAANSAENGKRRFPDVLALFAHTMPSVMPVPIAPPEPLAHDLPAVPVVPPSEPAVPVVTVQPIEPAVPVVPVVPVAPVQHEDPIFMLLDNHACLLEQKIGFLRTQIQMFESSGFEFGCIEALRSELASLCGSLGAIQAQKDAMLTLLLATRRARISVVTSE